MDEVRWIAGEPPPPWWHRWRWPMVAVFVIGSGLCFFLYALVARQRADEARQRLVLARHAFTEAEDLVKTAEATFERGDTIAASDLADSALRRARESLLLWPDDVDCLQVVDRALLLMVARDKELQALAEETLAPCGDRTEARLIRLRLQVEPLLDRWAVVSSNLAIDAARPDPALDELRMRLLADCDALLPRRLSAHDAEEVRARRALRTHLRPSAMSRTLSRSVLTSRSSSRSRRSSPSGRATSYAPRSSARRRRALTPTPRRASSPRPRRPRRTAISCALGPRTRSSALASRSLPRYGDAAARSSSEWARRKRRSPKPRPPMRPGPTTPRSRSSPTP